MKKIISQVKKDVTISTSAQNVKLKIANEAFDLVKNQIKNYSEIVDIEFGGSFAKDTWLPNDADIDIFIKFKTETSEENFEKISKKIGFAALKKYSPYVRYSEHPYVEASIKKTKINIVPCYDVNNGEWKSAADRTPFHTKFMMKNLNENMKNEVKVLKKFLKSNKIYGAEIARQGFSGYISEVLIYNFKTFENLIEKMCNIKENQVIGITNKKFDTSIVIVDPIDKNRNLAAAISNQNIGKFVMLCRAFQNNPKISYFKIQKSKISKKFWKNLLSVRFDFSDRSPDIIWGQVKRASSTLATQLDLGGFNVLRNGAFVEKKQAYLFFMLKEIEISKIHSKIGPEFFRKDATDNFVKKNISSTEMIWINHENKIISLENRKYIEADKFLQFIIKTNLDKGIPKGLKKDFQKGFKIFVGKQNFSKSIKEAANEIISSDEILLYSN